MNFGTRRWVYASLAVVWLLDGIKRHGFNLASIIDWLILSALLIFTIDFIYNKLLHRRSEKTEVGNMSISKTKAIFTYISKNIKSDLKLIFENPTKTIFVITSLVVIIYFGIRIYKAIKPETYQEKYMHCLELGSNARTFTCLEFLKRQYN